MTTPPAPSYRKTPKGYKKNPWTYNDCACGFLKHVAAKQCIDCYMKEHRDSRRPIQQPNDPTIRHIPLSKGQYAIVDEADYAWLNQWKWYARWSKTTKSYYAARNDPNKKGKHRSIQMHREILGLYDGDKREGDHANHNTLDNRRFINGEDQLRIATTSENHYNARINSNNTSGYKGVRFNKIRGKWYAEIFFNGNRKYLGQHETPELAYAAYCKAAEEHHGKFSCLG